MRAQKERQRQEALFRAQSTTQQKLEQAVAEDEQLAAQLLSGEASLKQAQALLASDQLAVEAEKRSKAVLESQAAQLLADLHAKEDGLTVAKVDLGYTTIAAPDDGTVGERQVRPGQLVSPETEVIPFVNQIKWVQPNYRETQMTKVVQRIPLKIALDDASIAATLRPGPSVIATVRTKP